MVLLANGKLKKAHELMERSLRIDTLHFGKEHLKVAANHHNLARVLSEMGIPVAAQAHLEKALAIYEKQLPTDHPRIAATLVNLGAVLNDLRLHERAEEVLTRAEAVQRSVFGDRHPHLACTLSGLQSAREGQVSIDWSSMTGGMSAISSGVVLNNAACEDVAAGRPAAAVAKLRQVVESHESTFGAEHPELIEPLINLATTLDGMDRSQETLVPTARALDVEEQVLSGVMELADPEETEMFLDRLGRSTYWALTLQLRLPEDKAAVALGLTTVLRRKGRALEARARPQGALDDPETDELMRALRKAREEWTFLHLRGGSLDGKHSEELCRLSFRIRLLGSELRKAHHRLGTLSLPVVTIEKVRQRLPSGAALIEIFLFDPFDQAVTARQATPRYLAYVLHGDGKPSWVELGDMASVDRAVTVFRDSLDSGGARLQRASLRSLQADDGEDTAPSSGSANPPAVAGRCIEPGALRSARRRKRPVLGGALSPELSQQRTRSAAATTFREPGRAPDLGRPDFR